ncbi:hypothetical protein [Ruegeria faecimaris]|uniref:hypothetical protein n=1 Tax=Ruegeria faecimaris TaxID=686389 RepID=UPI0024929736|nr:hypothetical protein [Ruegeria faecimaris]
MIRYALMVSAALTAAGQAGARDISVRSGEHDGYTRLVVQVPPGTEWGLKQTKNGARLDIALPDAEFQTGAVFQRLSQNRLSAISQTNPGDALEMEFGCDCFATAFLHQNTMIVVDIAPGAALPPISSDTPPPTLPKTVVVNAPLPGPQALDPLVLPLLNLNAQVFEDQLSTRLLQGADRDLVDLELSQIGPRNSNGKQSLDMPPRMDLNIAVTSVLDDLDGLLGPSIPKLEKKPACISSAELGFDSWSDGRLFPEQVAELRTGLFQEFDRVDKEPAMKLAKLYAYFGFGAEAVRSLGWMGEETPETNRISVIATVLDDRPLKGSNPFRDLQRCESDAAIWAALTEGKLAEDAQIRVMEQSFARLPDHLRRQVGPMLSDIFVAAQKLEAARRVLRAVDRIETKPSPGAIQAEAGIAKAEGDQEKSETLLKDVVGSSEAGLEAPLALARLIEQRWAERGSASARELELAASYTVELRRSEIGPLMQRTYALALSLGQEFDQSFDLLEDIPNSAETLDRAVQVLTARADDDTFLRRIFNLPEPMAQSLTTETAISIAERLASLGFARSTLFWSNRPQDTIRRKDRALLRAQAALLSGQPHKALLELGDDPSDKAMSLRAQANLDIGEFENAGRVLLQFDRVNEAERLFWLSDMEDVPQPAVDQKFGQVRRATLALAEPVTRIEEQPLADATALLENSANARENIAQLLALVRAD